LPYFVKNLFSKNENMDFSRKLTIFCQILTNFEFFSVEKYWNYFNGQILKLFQWTNFEIYSMEKFCSFLSGQILQFSHWTNFETFPHSFSLPFLSLGLAYSSTRLTPTQCCHLPYVHRPPPCDWFFGENFKFLMKISNFWWKFEIFD